MSDHAREKDEFDQARGTQEEATMIEQAITADTSDGYHTFRELYAYRKGYNALLFNAWAARGLYDVHKAWKHSDGEACFGGGWFIVVAQMPTGQISNHYPTEDWALFQVPERERGAEWDGHTPQIALDRLLRLAAIPSPPVEDAGSSDARFTDSEKGKAIGSADKSLVGRIHDRLMALAQRCSAIKADQSLASVAREEASTRWTSYMVALEIIGEEEARPIFSPPIGSATAGLIALIAKWRDASESGHRSANYLHAQEAHESSQYERGKADARGYCADDLFVALTPLTASQARAHTKEDVLTRSGELAVDPPPQHASADLKG